MYRCPNCGSDELTETIERLIEFDVKTGKRLNEREVDDSVPSYFCRNCGHQFGADELVREEVKYELASIVG
ncbi:hypothetical protein KAW65_00290 [candidate division WOR-3 bacterium]|nr:hypothetical protein [candidate division WOR-3 bacterium]